jgi:hypothetical protein
VTEFGIDSCQAGNCQDPAGLERQANEYAQAAADLQNGVLRADKLFYYRLEDTTAPNSQRWGLTEADFDPKPSYWRVKDTVWDVCWTTTP